MSLSKEIIDRFNKAFKQARVSGEQEPTAMVLATSDGMGLVTSRTVLLKALDEDGFVFLPIPVASRATARGLSAGRRDFPVENQRLPGTTGGIGSKYRTRPPMPISRPVNVAARSAPGLHSNRSLSIAGKPCFSATTNWKRLRGQGSTAATALDRLHFKPGNSRIRYLGEYRLHDRVLYRLKTGPGPSSG